MTQLGGAPLHPRKPSKVVRKVKVIYDSFRVKDTGLGLQSVSYVDVKEANTEDFHREDNGVSIVLPSGEGEFFIPYGRIYEIQYTNVKEEDA